MPMVDMRDMLHHAYENGYAVGAFEVVDLDFLGAVLDAAERCRAPIILSVAEARFSHGDFETVMPAIESAARRASVPTAIHFEYGSGLDAAVRAINLGCNGVMIDTSREPLDRNLTFTRLITQMASGCSVPVEGQLGHVTDVEGEGAESHSGRIIYTSVEEAKVYVKRTGVDFLAVSIGTVRGRRRRRPKLDYRRLARINDAVAVPLVIHGGTGLSDEQFQKLIAHGVAKINYYTGLSDVAAACLRANAQRRENSPTGLRQGVRQAIAEECERCMRVWGSAGRAAEVLMQCTPWQPIEHVILYNVEERTPVEKVMGMMRESQRVLVGVPGVRNVFVGTAVSTDAGYAYCALVRFVHPSVIDGYREHPLQRAFADHHLRPLAPEGISTDYAAACFLPLAETACDGAALGRAG